MIWLWFHHFEQSKGVQIKLFKQSWELNLSRFRDLFWLGEWGTQFKHPRALSLIQPIHCGPKYKVPGVQVVHSIVPLTRYLTDCHRDALGVSLSRELKKNGIYIGRKQGTFLMSTTPLSFLMKSDLISKQIWDVFGISDVIVYHMEGRKGSESCI